MAQKFYNDPFLRGLAYPVIGKNSEQFSVADPVTIDSSGFLAVCATNERVYGYIVEAVTMSSTNQTVAKVCPQVAQPNGVLMQYTADQACTQTDIGQYADVSGTTGAIKIDLNSGSTGVFLVVGYAPGNDASTEVIVEAAERLNDLGA